MKERAIDDFEGGKFRKEECFRFDFVETGGADRQVKRFEGGEESDEFKFVGGRTSLVTFEVEREGSERICE